MALLFEIGRSFRAMPLWVQLWIVLILVPVNLASYAFFGETMGALVACLAIGGLVPNFLVAVFERGFTKVMGIAHLAVWGPLVIFLTWIVQSPYAEGAYLNYLWLLLAVNGLSLVFDVRNTWKWAQGDRALIR